MTTRAPAAQRLWTAPTLASNAAPRSTTRFASETAERNRRRSASSIAKLFTVRMPESASLKRAWIRAQRSRSARSRRVCFGAASAAIAPGSGAKASTTAASRRSSRTRMAMETRR